MENNNENQTPSAPTSDRRAFLKKMVVAGAFATPVVTTFARGVRASNSLQAALTENAASNAQGGNSPDNKVALTTSSTRPPSTIARSSNMTSAPASTSTTSTTRPPVAQTSNTTVPPRTKNSALPTKKKPSTKATPTTVKPRVKNGTLSTTSTTSAPRAGRPRNTTTSGGSR